MNDQDLAKIRNIAKLLLEHGLTSAKLQTAEDIANLTKKKLEAGRDSARNEFYESSSEYRDDDGFYDWEENLTGHDPNDKNSKPIQEEVDANLVAEEAGNN